MTTWSGVEFFENQETHGAYQARRDSGAAPNELLEEGAFDDLLGNVHGLDVLDLGCGDARYGRRLIERGCASYVGVDGSGRMVELAEQALAGSRGSVRQANIEGLALPQGTLDVVISRMTLHWLEDLAPTFESIARALRPSGKLVFSVEHPVLTCCAEARVEGQPRGHWLVDDYFVTGPRTSRWFGVTVRKFHRSVEEYFRLLRSAGFRVVDLREAMPSKQQIRDEDELRRRQRVPLMLLIRAER
jgi:SAM-dependent methyltransferase